MKKSEMDELHRFQELLWMREDIPHSVARQLERLLDTFEVDDPIDKEYEDLLDRMQTPENKEAIKKAWDEFGKPKRVIDIDPNTVFGPAKEPKPKRKWHKWSELKDKFFTKKQQKEMKEQAEKELEEDG